MTTCTFLGSHAAMLIGRLTAAVVAAPLLAPADLSGGMVPFPATFPSAIAREVGLFNLYIACLCACPAGPCDYRFEIPPFRPSLPHRWCRSCASGPCVPAHGLSHSLSRSLAASTRSTRLCERAALPTPLPRLEERPYGYSLRRWSQSRSRQRRSRVRTMKMATTENTPARAAPASRLGLCSFDLSGQCHH